MWTSTDLLASVRRRTGMPAAAGLFSDAEILTCADEETRSYLVPFVLSEREDYWTENYDVSLVDGTASYRLPYRAVGGKLRDVYLIDQFGNARSMPRITGNDLTDARFGFYFEGNKVTLVNSGDLTFTRLGVTLRMVYYLRPNALVATTSAAMVTTFDTVAKTITFSACSSLASATSFDVIRAKPGFDTLGFDQAGSINVGNTIVTMVSDLPDGLEVGDYVCLPQQTPVPQVPAEMHDLLAQRVAVAILKAKNLSDKAAVAESELKTLSTLALKMLSPRVEGESQQIINRRGLYRVRF
jgi:hypothetical protein